MNLSFNIHHTMREKCPNTELFLVRVFLYSDWIRRDTEYLPVFSPNTGKHGPKITPYLDTFHTVTNLKYDLRYLCVTRMTQAWNVYVNNFRVLKWFVETTKKLCDWECITIPYDADAFHVCSALIQFWNVTLSSFSEWKVSMGECRP